MNKFTKVAMLTVFSITLMNIRLPDGLSELEKMKLPPRDAHLLLRLGEPVSLEEGVVSLLKRNKNQIIEALRKGKSKLRINIVSDTNCKSERVKACKEERDTDINDIDFLFNHACIKKIGFDDRIEGNIYSYIIFPKKMLLFAVEIPVVLKGNDYGERDGVMIIADFSTYSEETREEYREGKSVIVKSKKVNAVREPVPATLISFVLDEEGNIYDEYSPACKRPLTYEMGDKYLP